MKILLGCLAHQLNSEVVKGIFTQEWDDPDGFDVLFSWGADIRPDEDRFQAVTRKYQALQRTFLSSSADVLCIIEQDMLIPPNALQRLALLIRDGADVAYALYCWRYLNWHKWNAYPQVQVDGDVPHSVSLSDTPELARKHWGGIIQVGGLGFGCTMINRQTLTRLGFRQYLSAAVNHSADTAFAIDAHREGLIQVADLGCVCGHQMGAGQVVWPDPEQDQLYRIDTATAGG